MSWVYVETLMFMRCVKVVQKSAEELKRQQERDAEERTKTIASRVPQLSIDGLDKGIHLTMFSVNTQGI